MIKCLLTFTSVLGMACIISYTYFIWYCILKMDKLVKLLNEYHFSWTEFIWYYLDEEENRIYFKTEVVDKWIIDEQRISNERIISKRFGFIEWLVENNKIERLTFCESWLGWKYTDFELSYDTPREDYTNMLLMELAIQDEPVEYLISILK